jgi:GDP-L-fucose synthase
MTFDLAGKRVFVAGHNGMVGSAITRRLKNETCEILTASRCKLDLTCQSDVEKWFAQYKPDAVVMAAAKVGGIAANAAAPTDFLLQNLLIETNTIKAAYETGVKKFLFLGSSCIYPKHAAQPIAESALLTGALEATNQWYAIAKIAGLKLCEAFYRQHGADFISAMPCNLYGIHDNFDLETSHVVPALIRKIHEAKISGTKTVTLWGTGKPLREFLYVDDLADGLIFLLNHYSAPEHINVGSGQEVTIADLAHEIANIIGYDGKFEFDTTRPDGTQRKLLDNKKIHDLGWRAQTSLAAGLKMTYNFFYESEESHGKSRT